MRRTIATLLLPLALFGAACSSGDDSVVADGGAPTPGGGDGPLFLSIEVGGGFVPVGHDVRMPPRAVVYADGTTFTAGATIAIYPGPAVLPVIEGQLDDEQLEAILEAAADAGLLDGDPLDVGEPPIADAPTTTITLVVDGDEHVTSVYALDEVGGGGAPAGIDDEQQANRDRVRAFVQQVSELVTGAEGDTYEPERYLVLPLEARASDDEVEPNEVDWPLDDVALTEMACVTVTGDHVEQLRPALDEATEITRWPSADGEFNLVVRALLPHEPACPEAGPADGI